MRPAVARNAFDVVRDGRRAARRRADIPIPDNSDAEPAASVARRRSA
jgi:hypothetical protein